MNLLFVILFLFFIIPLIYWLLLAIAAIRPIEKVVLDHHKPKHHFAITIPAHNEGAVIVDTVKRLLNIDYPSNMYSIYIVADHCSDSTAKLAREAGAVVHERNEGPRTGKSAALSWLFQRVLEEEQKDAILIFDADTLVDPYFLRIMDIRLSQGDQVIQGQHVISNPTDSWFAALTWAMFIIDNRIQNQGRSNLGWSAKHMGDSICFISEVLQKMGCGEGLTEDFHLRQCLLLDDTCITYEPSAKGFGEAPQTWLKARAQRARWLRGTADVRNTLGSKLREAALKKRRGYLVDGVLQAYFPSYSTLSLLSSAILVFLISVNLIWPAQINTSLIVLWIAYVILLFLYPFWGLILEKAPLRAYFVILSGPIFIFWRTWLATKSRLSKKQIQWVRTDHGNQV